jgi:hypothetical protein
MRARDCLARGERANDGRMSESGFNANLPQSRCATTVIASGKNP